MTKLGAMFVLSHEISIATKEEAQRWGHPQIDVEHLFLALLINAGPPGEVLRDLGVDVAQARSAVEETHAAQVASLGLKIAPTAPGRLVDPMIGDTDWSPRAMAVLGEMSDSSDGLALLSAVIDEPSGLMAAVLARLDLEPASVHELITARREVQQNLDATPTRDRQTVSHSGFVPTPIEEVWALVADPLRRPEWDSSIGSVEPAGALVWTMWAAETMPDGKRRKVSPDLQRSRVREIARVSPERVVWETSWPARGQRTGSHVFAITLASVSGGTRIRLTWRLPRAGGWRGLAQRFRAPYLTLMTRMQLITTIAQISRCFR